MKTVKQPHKNDIGEGKLVQGVEKNNNEAEAVLHSDWIGGLIFHCNSPLCFISSIFKTESIYELISLLSVKQN